jgi:hypothetical protein
MLELSMPYDRTWICPLPRGAYMHLSDDLRYSLRAIQHSPGFSLIAIATLALGIGSTTAIFSVFDGVLLRPLGYGDESRLVAIHDVVPKFAQPAPRIPVNALHFH